MSTDKTKCKSPKAKEIISKANLRLSLYFDKRYTLASTYQRVKYNSILYTAEMYQTDSIEYKSSFHLLLGTKEHL